MIPRVPVHHTHTKLQRWTDLIAALLGRRLGAAFTDLARDVPAYAAGLDPAHKDSVKRTFERDKDELRALGVPIETVADPDGDGTRYMLAPAAFYLPFLALPVDPVHLPPEGYRSLPTVTFSPQELDLVVEAVARLGQLGDPTLAEDARAAANKLAFDLPLVPRRPDVHLLDVDGGADPRIFDLLGEALRSRKTVSFTYRKPDSGRVTERRVEPLGLFFVNAHWYLAARDRTRDDIRTFRVSRIAGASVTRTKGGAPDFEPPAGWNLREHARARDVWELGETESRVAEVDFVGDSGVAAAAKRAGEAVPGRPRVRRFRVRRLDAFVRWLLSFAGDARPIAPPDLVDAYEQAARDTLSVYTTQR